MCNSGLEAAGGEMGLVSLVRSCRSDEGDVSAGDTENGGTGTALWRQRT